MFLIALILIPVVSAICFHQIVSLGLPRFFLVPTHNWQDKILQVINHTKPIYLKAGPKRSSYRRRLITASIQPSFYTNFVNNKLKISPLDGAGKNGQDNSFLSRMKARAPDDPNRKLIFGFFHPYANNGGGGEKVLWQAVSATLSENERNIVAVYTTNTDAEPLQIVQKAREKFKVKNLDTDRIVLIYLRKFSKYIDAGYWKHFTLAGQLIGSVLLGLEAIYELSPDVWIDTMGLPGSYWPVSVILKTPIVAYVHYPIIQPDMFSNLKFKTIGDIKTIKLTMSDARQFFKFTYWSLLYLIYVYLGSCVDVTLANGTWTFDHISSIWSLNRKKVVEIVYPPCSTEDLSNAAGIVGDSPKPRDNKLLYIAQFRPEKRHALVLEHYNLFVKRFRETKCPLSQLPTLVFLGSCRTATDSSTLDSLRAKVTELDLSEFVEFIVDCSFDEVRRTLKTCSFGLNAMWNEHFGIGVVEYLSAGVVPIVHASAGPLLDIVRKNEFSKSWKNELGYFFKDKTDPDYAHSNSDGLLEFIIRDQTCVYPSLTNLLQTIFLDHPDDISAEALQSKRELGVKISSERFSNKQFIQSWNDHMRTVTQLEVEYRETRRDKVDQVY